jgi:uncharacterized membrane protein
MEVVKPVGFPARYVVAGVASVLAVAVFWFVYTWPSQFSICLTSRWSTARE